MTCQPEDTEQPRTPVYWLLADAQAMEVPNQVTQGMVLSVTPQLAKEAKALSRDGCCRLFLSTFVWIEEGVYVSQAVRQKGGCAVKIHFAVWAISPMFFTF